MTYTRGMSYHPQTQGKIQRWHPSLKSQMLLVNFTPADVYIGRGQRILDLREEVKCKIFDERYRSHFKLVA